MSSAQYLVVTGYRAAFLRCLFEGQVMHSVLEILLVTVKEGKAKKTGNDYKIYEAHCVLLKDDGTPGAVGVLNIPKALETVAKPGKFTAAFGLEASTFGDNAGKIIAVLSGLTPLPPGAIRARPAMVAEPAAVR